MFKRMNAVIPALLAITATCVATDARADFVVSCGRVIALWGLSNFFEPVLPGVDAVALTFPGSEDETLTCLWTGGGSGQSPPSGTLSTTFATPGCSPIVEFLTGTTDPPRGIGFLSPELSASASFDGEQCTMAFTFPFQFIEMTATMSKPCTALENGWSCPDDAELIQDRPFPGKR